MSKTLNLTELAEFFDSMVEKSPELFAKVLGGCSEQLLKNIDDSITDAKQPPIDTGTYRRSWTWKVSEKQGAKIEVQVFNTAPHASLVEMGRRPGPLSGEAIAAIEAWMERKGIDKSALGPILKKIQFQGFKPRHIMGKAIAKLDTQAYGIIMPLLTEHLRSL